MIKAIGVIKSNQLSGAIKKSDIVRIWLDIEFNALIISDYTLCYQVKWFIFNMNLSYS